MTGGLPLFVQNCALLVHDNYESDASRLCDDLESRTHASTTLQEIVLPRLIDTLTPEQRDSFGLFGLSDVPLQKDEIATVLRASLNLNENSSIAIVRRLVTIGVMRQFGDMRFRLHEAFRLIASEHRSAMDPVVVNAGRLRLSEVLERSLAKGGDIARLRAYLRLLPETGRTDTLINIAGEEFVHEYGLPESIRPLIENAIKAGAMNAKDCFWAYDTLVFWAIQDEDHASAAKHLSMMSEFIDQIHDNSHEHLSLLTKQMSLRGHQGNVRMVRRLFRQSLNHVGPDAAIQRFVRHSYAAAMYAAGEYHTCHREALKLYEEYLGLLGLKTDDLIGKSAESILTKLKHGTYDRNILKYLADACVLMANSRTNQRGSDKLTWLLRMQAVKAYGLAGAFSSLLRYGQDLVNDFVGPLNDPNGARHFIEKTMLPALEKYSSTELSISVRGQYAVILAYCNSKDAALSELDKLVPFIDSLRSLERSVLERQIQIVNAIVYSQLRQKTGGE